MNAPAALPRHLLPQMACPPANWPVACAGAVVHVALLAGVAIVADRDITVLARPSLVAFLVLMAAWCATEALSHAPRSCRNSGPRRAKWLPVAIGVVLLACSVIGVSENALRIEAAPALVIIRVTAGSTMMVIGIVLRIIAIRSLGRFFLDGLTLLDDHRCVSTGIYAHMHHPSELGTLCLATGTVVMLGSPTCGLVSLLILLPLVLARMHLENILMAKVTTQVSTGSTGTMAVAATQS